MTMALTRAEIQWRYRERKSKNLRLLEIEVDDALVEDVLIARGHLSPQDVDDSAKVAAALRAAVMQTIAPPAEPEDDVTGNAVAFWFVR